MIEHLHVTTKKIPPEDFTKRASYYNIIVLEKLKNHVKAYSRQLLPVKASCYKVSLLKPSIYTRGFTGERLPLLHNCTRLASAKAQIAACRLFAMVINSVNGPGWSKTWRSFFRSCISQKQFTSSINDVIVRVYRGIFTGSQ